MTKDEAQKECDKKNEVAPTDFCPLISSLCNPACTCYQKPWVRELSKNGYRVEGCYCGNAMFSENRTVTY